MKKIVYSSILLPLIYSMFALYRAPSIADALILLGLCGLSAFLFYIESRGNVVDSNQSDEIRKLQYEIEVKRLEDSLANLNFQSAQQQARRDEMSAAGKRENFFGL